MKVVDANVSKKDERRMVEILQASGLGNSGFWEVF